MQCLPLIWHWCLKSSCQQIKAEKLTGARIHTKKHVRPMGQSLRTDILDTAPVSCLDLKQENYPCGFHHSFLIFGETWKIVCSIWWIKFCKTYSPSSLFSEHKRRGKEEFSGGVDVPPSTQTTLMCISLKHPKHSQISYWILIFCSDSAPVWGSPRDFFSPCPLLLFHFLPVNGKTKITLLKSMALQGQSLCVGASGKQEQRWLNGTLRDLEFQGLLGLGA